MIRALLLATVLGATAGVAGATETPAPLPFKVGGAFALVDQHGQARTEMDPDGLPQLLFFGYANCPGICTAALPLIGDTTRALAARGIKVRPVMITVDPKRDSVGNMAGKLEEFHPAFVGLTGDDEALGRAYKAFSIQRELAFEDPEFGEVFVHGSFIYLLDSAGKVLTLFPPVQDAQQAATTAAKYLTPQG